jgi:1,4-dihydroxy-2-naphthoate octaprenyltransferase
MLESSSPLPLLVVFAVLCMLCIIALLVAAYFGEGWVALIFAVGLVGSLVGLMGTGGQP